MQVKDQDHRYGEWLLDGYKGYEGGDATDALSAVTFYELGAKVVMTYERELDSVERRIERGQDARNLEGFK